MMKRLLSNDYVLLGVRLVLGAVFLVACYDKILDPAGFTRSILNYRIVEPQTAMLVATVLPWMEFLAGLGLILGVYYRGSSLLIAAMMGLFTLVVLSAVLRGLDITCGCFTQDPNASKVGWMKVGENIVLTALAFVALLGTTTRFMIRLRLPRTETDQG